MTAPASARTATGAGGATALPAAGRVRLHRDRVTYLVFAFVCVHGYFLFSFNTSLSLLREDTGMSRAVAGLHGTAFAVGVVVSGLTSARLAERVGRGRVLQLGVLALVAGIVLYTTTGLVPLTLLAGVVGGYGGSLIANTHVTVFSDHHPGPGGAAAITEANALAAGIGLLAPLALAAAAATLGWRAAVWVLVPFAALVLLWSSRVELPDTPRRRARTEGTVDPLAAVKAAERLAVRPLPRHYWAAWVALLLCVGAEFSLTIWTGDLLVQQHGVDPAEGARGVTALVAGMALGRVVGGRLALHWPIERTFVGALLLATAGTAVLWLAPTIAVAYAGLLLTGFGIAMHFPLGISRAVRDSGGQSDRGVALTGVGVGAAIGGAPFVLGAVADQVGTHTAFLLVPMLFLAAGVAAWARRPLARPRAATSSR